jgi:NitT/TauT family transport system substrate-binding protein
MSLSSVRRPRGRLRTLFSALSAAALFTVVAGCSALGGSSAPADGGGAAGGLEHPNIKVGLLPNTDVVAVQRAAAAGYFKAEGLNVELAPITTGSAGMTSLVAGDLDMTWSNYTSLIQAAVQKVADLRVLPDSYQAAPNSIVVLTRPENNIKTPQDLVGKKIAITAKGSISELLGRSALQTNGVDPNSVTFVEIPFADMPAALENHQIDANVILEPALTAEETAGAVTVMDAASGPTAELPLAGLALKADFAAQNPKTIAAFQRALDKGQADVADRAVLEQTLLSYTKIKPETTPLLNLGSYPPGLDATRLQRVADLMQQFGLIPGPFDVKTLMAGTVTATG